MRSRSTVAAACASNALFVAAMQPPQFSVLT